MLIAGVLLKLPDGKWVLHRRDKNALASPNLLGFFGGKIEENETAEQAALRELSEETSIDIKELKIKFLAKYAIPEPQPGFTDSKVFNLFTATITATDFEVYEGIGSEVYDIHLLKTRTDLTPSVAYAVNNLEEVI